MSRSVIISVCDIITPTSESVPWSEKKSFTLSKWKIIIISIIIIIIIIIGFLLNPQHAPLQ
jgi:hypothetical protein